MGCPNQPERVAAVDGLRGLLALVVLAWHVCAPFGLNWMLPLANVSVALFFVLSGYALTRGWDGHYGAYLLRRALRLWPTFALCLALGYVLAGVRPVWSEFLWYPYMDPSAKPAIDPPAWSLFLEAYATPFLPLLIWAGAARARAIFIACGLTAISLTWAFAGVLALFLIGSYLARSALRNRPLEARIPQWLGRVSYSLYLSHFLVLELGVRAFGPAGGIVALPAVFAGAWLLWFLVERPSIAASRRAARALRVRRVTAPVWG
jgi:peptidoglycan/LPS O-acetylase OafA/YrhL